MAGPRPIRDHRLLDAVEGRAHRRHEGQVWRVVRDGRDPLQCSSVGGRWDDRTFDVLYTSLAADGALAEMFFHLSRGQPVFPSIARYRLYKLHAQVEDCVMIQSLGELASLGLNTGLFGQLSYAERQLEYPRTQEIAEAAHFHGRGGLIVPSARCDHPNLVVFCDVAGATTLDVTRDHGLVDWAAWKARPFGY